MAELKLKVKSWQTPNFVLAEMPTRPKQDGIISVPQWPLQDVDAAVLAELCDEFRREIFLKAGKNDPFSVVEKG